jgi:hypothetical protein
VELMAWVFDVNQSPATGAVAMWQFIAVLKSAGWTQQDSSDGTTRGAAQVTSGGTGANGLGNNSAWVRLQDPAGVQEITIQRGTANTAWRMKYSPAAKFVGGSPSVTATPSAADETLLAGAGTDASPTTTVWFSADNGYKFHCGADNASPYGAYFFALAHGAATLRCGFVMDPIGQADTLDTAPVAFYRAFNASCFMISGVSGHLSATSATATSSGVLGKLASSYVCVPALAVGSFPGSVGVNPHSGKDDGVPLIYTRSSSLAAPYGYKGFATVMRLNGMSRTTGDTLNVDGGTKNYIIVGDVRLPWAGVDTVY